MEVDLIPADYRRYLVQRKRLFRYFMGWGLLVLVLVCGWLWLHRERGLAQQRIDRLKVAEQSVLEQRGQLDRLYAEKTALQDRLDRLGQVRGGPPVGQILSLLATAIDQSAWVEELSFARMPDTPPGQMPPGNPSEFGPTLTIRGKAMHNDAQATFVRNLTSSPEVAEVRILTSAARSYSFGSIIEFSLLVLLRKDGESP